MKTLLTLVIGFALVLTSFGDPPKDTSSAERLLTRVYKINANTFVRGLKQLAPPKTGEANQDLLLRFLKENHVEIQKAYLDEQNDRLAVRTTQVDLDKIDALVQKIMNPP